MLKVDNIVLVAQLVRTVVNNKWLWVQVPFRTRRGSSVGYSA